MSFQELKEQAVRLSVSNRLALISATAKSLHTIFSLGHDSGERSLKERSSAIQ